MVEGCPSLSPVNAAPKTAPGTQHSASLTFAEAFVPESEHALAARRHAAKIVMKANQNGLFRIHAQKPLALLNKFRRRAAPHRHPVGWFTFKCRSDTLS